MPVTAARVLRKLVRPPLALYDRLLGGRAWPGSDRVDRLVGRLETWAGSGNVPLSKEGWEEEYRDGIWDFLAGAGEAGRYRAITALIGRFSPGGRILDVGCGEGLLVDHLREAVPGASYLGLDLSEEAVLAARASRGDASTRFEVADAETWDGGEAADAIVLNECLYYFHDPLGTAERYLGLLGPEGVLVVSMYEAPRTLALSRGLRRRLPPLEQTRLEGPPGAWFLSVHRRPG